MSGASHHSTRGHIHTRQTEVSVQSKSSTVDEQLWGELSEVYRDAATVMLQQRAQKLRQTRPRLASCSDEQHMTYEGSALGTC
jgi:hypothetical protein